MRKHLHNRVNRDELRKQIQHRQEERITLSFYIYSKLAEPITFRDQFYTQLSLLDVLGRIYIAHEGINAQISVPTHRFDEFKSYLDSFDFLTGIRLNIAVEDDGKSFFTLAIKVKDKIVADGIDDTHFDVTRSGPHLSVAEFNTLADDPETIIVDMRNHYESEIGHFKDAILPPMETFREGLPLVAALLREEKDKPIVMYCTGGIRCEKASAYMKYRGFQNVFQLDGGIIEYTRQAEMQGLPNKFIGKNFVFDERLGERISADVISACHQCGDASDVHTNCANDACHLLFIQCLSCAEDYEGCCSEACREFKNLPEDVRKKERKIRTFNGTHFSKSKPGMLRK